MLKIENVVKSNESKQVTNGLSVIGNTDTYVKLGVTTHTQYNNDVSMLKSQFLFDTTNNPMLLSAIDETLDITWFETIGEEPIICGCIKIQDIIDIYASGCIQEFYDAFCKSHSDEESKVLARFLSAIGIEIWKDITCYGGIYKGKYMVSNLGNVKSLNEKHFGKILKPLDCGHGYLCVWLCHNYKKQIITVHRLVALTFYGEPTEKLESCHANGIKTDNRLFNLDLKTHIENLQNPLTKKKNKDKFNKKAESASTSATE